MSLLSAFNNNRINFFFVSTFSLFPVVLLLGSGAINIVIVIIDVFFLYRLYVTKNFNYLNNKFFYSLLIFWIYLIINLFFSLNFEGSISRSFGFIRFIIFTFSIRYFFNEIDNDARKLILNSWTIIFFIVSFDLIFEYILGYNILGFSSYMPGRLSGFLNQELKIGHFYSAFILIFLCNLHNYFYSKNVTYFNHNIFWLCVMLSISISLMIGERSNFFKVFIMIIIFIFLINKQNLLKKIISISIALGIFSLIIINNPSYKHRYWHFFIKPVFNNPVKFVLNTDYGSHYLVAIEVFKNHKFFGVGLKNYRLEVQKEKYDKNASVHPHQIHFEVIAELGLVGYIFFISILAFNIYFSFKYFLKNGGKLQLSGLLFVIATLIPIIPSGSFFTTFGAALFWLNYSFMLPKGTNILPLMQNKQINK